MMASTGLGLTRHRSAAPRKILALDLAPGDALQISRGRDDERVVSVARNDGSLTIDCLFASGRRATFRYNADLAIASD